MSTMTTKVLDAIIVLNILEITTEELSSAFLEQLLVGLDFFKFFFWLLLRACPHGNNYNGIIPCSNCTHHSEYKKNMNFTRDSSINFSRNAFVSIDFHLCMLSINDNWGIRCRYRSPHSEFIKDQRNSTRDPSTNLSSNVTGWPRFFFIFLFKFLYCTPK